MSDIFTRTEMLLGSAALEKLHASKVAVFGIGGVGSFAVEGLARSGVGHLALVDHDHITVTNINRQIHATRHTLGLSKAAVMRERVLDINPEAQVTVHQLFYRAERCPGLLSADLDYIIDAVDSIGAKIDLVMQAREMNIPIISCMGAGNKLDPTRFEVADIYETSVCPLARVMRRELRKRGVRQLKVVYSTEPAVKRTVGNCQVDPPGDTDLDINSGDGFKRIIPGSVAFVTAAAGLILAAAVVKDLIAPLGAPAE
ncbi:MAG: tRNA threonylcarbamoyladenosine dehydratase [Syntrophomonadaceae bacterium]